jgi:flagellar M-ring protein FliF
MAQVASMGDMSSDDPVDRLREMISDHEDETIQILQNWMEDPSKKEQV